jgi:hypothetical protein
MSDNKKWWFQVGLSTGLALLGIFKGEVLPHVQAWWTALTVPRILICGGVAWLCWLLISRFVLRPIHEQLDLLTKRQDGLSIRLDTVESNAPIIKNRLAQEAAITTTAPRPSSADSIQNG